MSIGMRTVAGRVASIALVIALAGGAARAGGPASELELNLFLGLDPGGGLDSGSLTNLGNGPVTTGSAIMRMLDVTAGDTLTFSYNFLTNAPSIDSDPLGAVNPFAFITSPDAASIADNGFLFTPPTTPAPGVTGYALQTGFRTETITFTTTGMINLGFGVANVTTDEFASALLLGNVFLTSGNLVTNFFTGGDLDGFGSLGSASVVTSSFGIAPPGGTYQVLLTTAAVPEPSSVLMLSLGGLAAAVGYRRRSSSN